MGLARNSTRDTLFAGVVVAHRFALKRLLGKGGMGVVWEVQDKKLGRTVALKFLGTEIASDLEAVSDLQRETRRSLELTHPNIVRVYDYVEDHDFQVVGISMELLTGQSLQALKLQQPKWVFTPEKVLPWLRQICSALDYAHQTAGVVHRDLKPGNIFIDDQGALKIVDFGVAMVVRESTSHVFQEARLSRSGTLTYMSPQQLSGDKPTPADDWYSVGALLYELFTGKPPFFRGDPHALMLQVMANPPVPLAQRQAEMGVTEIRVPPSWEQAIMACLSKDASARPKSGTALLALIEGDARPSDSPVPAAESVPSPVDHDKTVMQMPPLYKSGRAAADPLLSRSPIHKGPAKGQPAFSRSAHPHPAPAGGGPRSVFMSVTLMVLLLASLYLFWRYGPQHQEVAAAAPPRPAAPPPPAGLTLKVDPIDANAQVQVDDQLPMIVPANGRLLVPDLPDGDHVISVQAPGFEPFKARTVLRNHTGEFDIGLVFQRGLIEVTARPGSRVIMRESEGSEIVLGEVGPSGIATFTERVRLGDATIRLEHPDCFPTDIRRFTVTAGQTSRIHADQKVYPASLSLATEPEGAEIFVDGQSRGNGPVELTDLKAETETLIEARLPGYEGKPQSYTFKPREHRDFVFHLQPIKGDVTVTARPGTRLTARRSGQTDLDLGTVGRSGEETYPRLLTQGRWTLTFEHPDCEPTAPVEIEVDRAHPAYVSAHQVPVPGSLDIRSEPPDVEIWIQGVKQGTTPALIDGLPAEKPLTVELRQRGRVAQALTVTLRPHERSTLFFDKLKPEYMYARVDVQPWEKLRGRKVAYLIDGTPEVPRSSFGSVVEMRFDSGAEHLLKIQAEGFRENSIMIDPSDTRTHRVMLEALPAQVSISSEPAGALVWLNDVGPRETPITFGEVAPGRYTVRVQKSGYSPHRQDVVVGAGEELKIGPVPLTPEPPRTVAVAESASPLFASAPPLSSPTSATGGASSRLSSSSSRTIVSPSPPPPVRTADPFAEIAAPSATTTWTGTIPELAQLVGTISLSGHTRVDYIVNVIRGAALARGWNVSSSPSNVLALNLVNQPDTATLYLRCGPRSVDIYSDSSRGRDRGRTMKIPTGSIRDLQSDLARQLY